MTKYLKNKIKNFLLLAGIKIIRTEQKNFKDSYFDLSQNQMDLLGKIAVFNLLNQNKEIEKLEGAEFKVYSQWGDDGIIQYLINKIDIKNRKFIEFGVENYKEANTRFLLRNNNWSGLVMDGSASNISYIKNSEDFWKFDLKAKCSFITAENINFLLRQEGIEGEIGILSIDIDGNDYWIWENISIVQPVIVIIEYNSIFGIDKAITVPYSPDFVRTKVHYSNLYAGSSLLALCDLAEEKGYDFVGSNSAGNNAYFVKKTKSKNLKKLSPIEGYRQSKFKEARDKDGSLSFINLEERLAVIKGMPVYNTRTKLMELL